jgi:hypothetical protein
VPPHSGSTENIADIATARDVEPATPLRGPAVTSDVTTGTLPVYPEGHAF